MSTPHSERYWSEVETWDRERIAELQLTKLRTQLAYVGSASDHYARSWRETGFDPGDLRSLEDLRKLPLVAKKDYVATLQEAPPWGSALAAPHGTGANAMLATLADDGALRIG